MAEKAKRRQAERDAYALNRTRGENKYWDYESSAGISVWQMIAGGRYQEFVGR